MSEGDGRGKQEKRRCEACRKKVGLMGFRCACCEKEFCTLHRLPEEHKCEKDFKALAHEKNRDRVLGEATQETHNYLKI